MPTIRRYFVKSVKNFLLIIAAIVLLPFAWYAIIIVISLIAPDTDLLMYTVDHIKEIGIGIVIAILIFLGYRALRVFKTEKFPGQEFKKIAPVAIVWLIGIVSLANYIAAFNPGYDCQKHNRNEKLNGGVKEFNGKKYAINICGSGINNGRFGDNSEMVILKVLNEQGELVAARYYTVDWSGNPYAQPIKVNPNSISYEDEDEDTYFKNGSVTMPPTFIDWIRLKIPLFS